jgi:RING finger protein 170
LWLQIIQQIRDAPVLFSLLWQSLTITAVLRLAVVAKMGLLVLGSLLYVLSPLDIVPEAVFGVFGYIDDIIVALYVYVFVASFVRSALLQAQAALE